MKVSICNFRCFTKPVIYNFQDGKVSLLKGFSGAGKSTILEAVRWCLFGSLRNIYPSGFTPTTTNKTYVILEIKNLNIQRSQAPEQLKLEVNGQTLIQDAAQAYIDKFFGNKNVWLASSFIRQNEKCPLITASNAERMTLLNEILFGSDTASEYENPDYYSDKIDEEIEKTSKEITGQTAIFNLSYSKYVGGLNTYVNKFGFTDMNSQQIKQYFENIQNVKSNISKLNNEIILTTTLENRRDFLQNKINDFQNPQELYTSDSFINDLSLKIENMKKELNLNISDKSKYLTLTKELEGQQKLIKFSDSVDLNILDTKIKTYKSEINQNKILLRNLQSYESQLSNLQYQYNSLLKEQEQNNCNLNNYEIHDINLLKNVLENKILENQINELQNKIDLLDCSQESNFYDFPDLNKSLKLHIESLILEIKYGNELCNKYSVDKETAQEYVQQIQQIIEFSKIQKVHLNNQRLYKETQTNIENLRKSIIPNDLNESDILSQIENVKRRMGNPLKCPCCDKILEFKNNMLIIPEVEIIDFKTGQKELEILNQKLQVFQKNKLTEQSIINLETRLSLIEPFDEQICSSTIYDDAQISRCITLVNDFNRVNYENLKKYNLNILEKQIVYINNLEQYNRYVNELNQLKIKVKTIDVECQLSIDQLRFSINNIPLLLQKKLQISQSIENIQNSINSITLSINNQSSIVIQNNITNLEKELTTLENQYREAEFQRNVEINIQRIQEQLQYLNIQVIENKITELTLQIEINTNELTAKRKNLELYKEYTSLITEMNKIIISKSSNDCRQELDRYNLELQNLEEMYKSALEYDTLNTLRKELEGIHSKITQLTLKQGSLNTLKNIITEVTNSTLQNLVDNINNTTNSILEELFETNIVVELKLYKELKVKQKVKPCVNIAVYYNGNTYDNVSVLSGGEVSRLSLAMTLALAIIHTSPVVFLDECLGSLDMNLREDCVEIIKKYLTENVSKTVINIEHSAIEGIYDDTINV